jgi:hypothetical protein
MDPRWRDSVLSQVTAYLNKTLTREWTRFGLDSDDSSTNRLRLEIRFQTPDANATEFGSLRLQLVELTEDGKEHFFYLENRSKGFYWFCNFVLKLEFNPKSGGGVNP